ncbi:MAG: tyrosine-type recombinase/integrase [Planctomycetia bacterium]|nr:tyrosine-type recombinase/integrase [Planctomycetia bacterium]
MEIDRDMTLSEVLTSHPEVEGWSLAEVWEFVRMSERLDKRVSASMSLSEFYEVCYRPEVSIPKGCKPLTLRERETSLRYWKAATGDPALEDITSVEMGQFVVFLREKGLASATIRKHCAAVQSVIDHAGSKREKHRDAKELIPFPPAFPRIRVSLNVTANTPNTHEVVALIHASEVATTPKLPGISAGDWWANAYKMLAFTGMRKGDLLGLRWEDLQELEWGTAFVIPAEREKTGVEKIIPISSAARAVLGEMPRGAENALIFEWPHCTTTFYRQRKKIIARAGLSRQKRGVFHAIRRYVATVVRDATLVLGHTSAAVTSRHYQSITRAAEALEELGAKIK